MQYGFIIDNRKCIGCHACTVACKSEHDVPVGVNRTWVKQVEKGTFPDTRRLFSVMRCNHCTDAPCVTICPTQALFRREDGIVDFNNDRCIGCKACMQACPYDALYIDPGSHTAAKCNYCAHRIDIGLEPACVNVCPEQAIISGDLDNPGSTIAKTLARETVSVRKAEKGTLPNVFYIDGDSAVLQPTATNRSDEYIFSSQAGGVGHFAGSGANTHPPPPTIQTGQPQAAKTIATAKSIDLLLNRSKRVYDAPDKGILWGWEVSGYVWTKAVSCGALLVTACASILLPEPVNDPIKYFSGTVALLFLVLTLILLVKDLDQPKRFLYVLLRPNWTSWLVRGGYGLSAFGGLLTLWLVAIWQSWTILESLALWSAAIIAVFAAVYTAFLFAQAKGRDFWQSPVLPLHMLVHSLMAGIGLFYGAMYFLPELKGWGLFLHIGSEIVIGLNLLIIGTELTIGHPTADARKTVRWILGGPYRYLFWGGVVLVGNILPILLFHTPVPAMNVVGALLMIAGIYITEHLWVNAPQRIPLS